MDGNHFAAYWTIRRMVWYILNPWRKPFVTLILFLFKGVAIVSHKIPTWWRVPAWPRCFIGVISIRYIGTRPDVKPILTPNMKRPTISSSGNLNVDKAVGQVLIGDVCYKLTWTISKTVRRSRQEHWAYHSQSSHFDGRASRQWRWIQHLLSRVLNNSLSR